MKKRTLILLISSLLILLFSTGLLAGEAEEKAIIKFFSDPDADPEEMFHSSFKKAVPMAEIVKIRDEYMGKLGAYKNMEKKGKRYNLIFEKGKTVCEITLTGDGSIVGFWIGNIVLSGDTWEKLLADIKKLDGQASVIVIKDGVAPVWHYNPDKQLAVGSTFKLYILQALNEKMTRENIGWNHSIALEQKYMSLPSGFLHKWPVGTQVTLDTLANLMISISDNTATDHLLFFVGRDQVEKIAPEQIAPFYSTAEMFRIKGAMSKKDQKKFIRASTKQKRKQLADINTISLDQVSFTSKPTLIAEVEWHPTTRELCQVIYKLKDSKAVSINPGLTNKDDWDIAGYKGGSEPGVLNHTYILQKESDPSWYSVSFTLNDPKSPIDDDKFNDLMSRLLHLIKSK